MSSSAAEISIAEVAVDALERYSDGDLESDLDNRYVLQLAAGEYSAALASLVKLRKLHEAAGSPLQVKARSIPFEIYARAKARQRFDGESFETSFGIAFRGTFSGLDDRLSALVIRAFTAARFPFGISLHVPIYQDLEAVRAAYAKQATPSMAARLTLVRAFVLAETFRETDQFTPALIAQDDSRRYVIERDRLVATPGGAHICALIFRPKTTRRLPALLEFTIYDDDSVLVSEARRSASNGYVGVEGLTRGKGCSPDPIVAWEHDGEDAAALIDWIAGQAWSDGQVGMFGASYNGFAQWSAARFRPRALKAMMPAVASLPGRNMAMEQGVPLPASYSWTFYTTVGKGLDAATYGDTSRWNGMFRRWYRSGRPYRDLDVIDGTPNPVWQRWMNHPTYDAYWSALVPNHQEFAKIDIPVLATTGYYDDGQIGVLHYFREHLRNRPGAVHYLVMGPYDHATGNRGTIDVLGAHRANLAGYQLDSSALIDFGDLRYAWFDHILKGGPRPAILKNRVNYHVMGTDSWKHVPSIDAAASDNMRLYFGTPKAVGEPFALSPVQPDRREYSRLVVDLADRSDADQVFEKEKIVDPALDTRNSLVFQSAPLPQAVELSGSFAAHLDFISNKKDFDFTVELYERMPDNQYLRLAHFLGRASIVGGSDGARRLLEPNRAQRIDFAADRFMSRRLSRDSRIIAVIRVKKNPAWVINYGSGKEVNGEMIADAGPPLSFRLSNDSYLDIPVSLAP